MRKRSLLFEILLVVLISSISSFHLEQNKRINFRLESETAASPFVRRFSTSMFMKSSRLPENPKPQVLITNPNAKLKDFVTVTKEIADKSAIQHEDADIIIVGGGVSGLSAAITASESRNSKDTSKIILLEANERPGGRVVSVADEDGFVYDQGFAVFIDQYPVAKEVLDMEALNLKPFLPGAFIKLETKDRLAQMADPLREPSKTFSSLFAPVGSLKDKLKLVPLIVNCRRKTVSELFDEDETDTLKALTQRWRLSDDIINKFFKPFFEGIYLTGLSGQSSRMFSFVFKMFSEGSATLPEGGMGAVTNQLVAKALRLGVDIKVNLPISTIQKSDDDNFIVESYDKMHRFKGKTVILATDGQIAQRMLSQLDGLQSLEDLPEQPQRRVGCLYYAFKTEIPIEEPILILNGMGDEAGSKVYPVNNVCFPSAVNKGYAPEGSNLCSVAVLEDAMECFKDKPNDLDQAVRNQLATWFPEQRNDILSSWELKKIFYIPNAQPGHFEGPFPANVNGGRPCNTFRDRPLPEGLLVCGDHMATSTLNGALESGVNAGQEAAIIINKKTSAS